MELQLHLVLHLMGSPGILESACFAQLLNFWLASIFPHLLGREMCQIEMMFLSFVLEPYNIVSINICSNYCSALTQAAPSCSNLTIGLQYRGTNSS